MKKLLELLSTSSLLITSMSSIFACKNNTIFFDQKEIIIPIKSNKNTLEKMKEAENSMINLSALSPTATIDAIKHNVEDFKTKLVNVLKISELINLDISKIKIEKDNGTNPATSLVKEDVVSGTIMVKISASLTDNTQFTNTKTITVNLATSVTNLNTLTTPTSPIVSTNGNVSEFKTALINALRSSNFADLTASDIDIKKINGADLRNSDITGSSITVKITAKNTRKYTGEITLSINHSTRLINLDTLPSNTIVNAIRHDVEDFKSQLVKILKTTSEEFTNLDTNKIKIKKYRSKSDETTDLMAKDIVSGTIKVKISTSHIGSTQFTNTKVITVILSNRTIDLNTLPDTVTVAYARQNSAEDFKTKLVEKLKTTNKDFESLDTSMIKIEKENDTSQATTLVNEDIVTGLIQVKISARSTENTQFTNVKIITVELLRVEVAPGHYQFSPPNLINNSIIKE